MSFITILNLLNSLNSYLSSNDGDIVFNYSVPELKKKKNYLKRKKMGGCSNRYSGNRNRKEGLRKDMGIFKETEG